MNSKRILYCGDTSLDSAAAYLSGLMTLWGYEFSYIPSDQQLSQENIPAECPLFIFSDYPAEMANTSLQTRIVEQVQAGAGLLMIGGWESWHGLGGDWDGTPVGDALPVQIANEDDRRNCDQPVFVRPATKSHVIIDGLPWSERPPLIGGFNAFTPTSDSQTLLEVDIFDARFSGNNLELQRQTTEPLLVVGNEGAGRTAALATDVAPHWIGPMVDWGTERVTACADGAGEIEVGNLYATFFKTLVSWTAQLA